MSLSAEALDALLAAGASAEMIVAAVKADGAADERKKAAKRQASAERQRRKRARDREAEIDVTRERRDAALPRVTDCDKRDPSLDKESSPTPPQRKLNPPGDVSSHAREAADRLVAGKVAFDRFWAAYPSRVGKADAAKRFPAALATIGGDDPLSVMLAAIERQAKGRKWLQGIIPNPATWLNQERWNDEVQPAELLDFPSGQRTNRQPPQSFRTEDYERGQANLARAFGATPPSAVHGGRDLRDDDARQVASLDR